MKTVIRGIFTTGEQWEETSNSEKEFGLILSKITNAGCCYITNVESKASYAEPLIKLVDSFKIKKGDKHEGF